jgi:hypothetical protein
MRAGGKPLDVRRSLSHPILDGIERIWTTARRKLTWHKNSFQGGLAAAWWRCYSSG